VYPLVVQQLLFRRDIGLGIVGIYSVTRDKKVLAVMIINPGMPLSGVFIRLAAGCRVSALPHLPPLS
jgi:hypothetical protein